MPTSVPAARSAQRRDVQGLRAVAVLAVVVNHLAPGVLPGGFTGVDVFLVLSGYLITGLLLREFRESGRISLADFYARRARRIVPAATLVIVVTALASLLVLPLTRTRDLLVDGLWASLFAANVRMAQVGTDYFTQSAPPSALRHYWSLAVEEQFYLVWPALLAVVALVVVGRGARAAIPLRGFLRTGRVLLLIALVASLLWSVHATGTSPTTAYYSTFTRVHELALGALLAFLPVAALSRPVREVLVWGGLGAVGVAFLFLGDVAVPGTAALLPTLGTAAVLLAGSAASAHGPHGPHPTQTWGGRLLGIRPAVAVGDWSYSLYLWHWPLVVLVPVALGRDALGADGILGVLVLSLFLSWVSYRWVETPFRTARLWRAPRRALSIYPGSVLAVAVVVVAASAVVDSRLDSDGATIRVSDYAELLEESDGGGDGTPAVEPEVLAVRAAVLAAREGREIPAGLVPSALDAPRSFADLGDCNYKSVTKKLCPLGDPDADRSIVLVGDSHARAASPAFVEIGRRHGYRVYVLGLAGCHPTALVQVAADTGQVMSTCERFKRWTAKTVDRLAPDHLVVASYAGWAREDLTGEVIAPENDGERFLDAAERGWTRWYGRLSKNATRTHVLTDFPYLDGIPADCLTTLRGDLGRCSYHPGQLMLDLEQREERAADAVGANVIDAYAWFCDEGVCPSVVGRTITMRDEHHVTPQYAIELSDAVARRMLLPEVVAQH
ncbi:acyltransferase family protein [Nocardioides yefusunii]|uniref:Acyltransferase family protein n=1 Tax=Nocardioides yefusunii TaxID=2500546 RepID=A0ABW1R1K4_9ACTN|nr:acyltransferase family protein [Nocardioides yefusunii]